MWDKFRNFAPQYILHPNGKALDVVLKRNKNKIQ